jgi:hypothetical protein
MAEVPFISILDPSAALARYNTLATHINDQASTQNLGGNVGFAVADLPPVTTDLMGTRAFVIDALTVPVLLDVPVGGGSIVCPVFCDGTNWVAG